MFSPRCSRHDYDQPEGRTVWPLARFRGWTGGTYFSLAANAGVMYVLGSLCFLVAALAPFVLFSMPLVFGALISLNLSILGLGLRRLAREAALPITRSLPPSYTELIREGSRTCGTVGRPR